MPGEIKLKEFGKHVSDTLGDGVNNERIIKQKHYLRELSSVQKQHKKIRYFIPAIASVFVFIILGYVYIQHIKSHTLNFQIGNNNDVKIGSLIEPGVQSELPIKFEDGSTITIFSGSIGQVIESTEKKVKFRLHNGSISAHIKHRKDSKWYIEAGDYQVTVIGTKFNISWTEQSRHFDLTVEEGIVRVTGPNLGKNGMLVTHNNSFHGPETKNEEADNNKQIAYNIQKDTGHNEIIPHLNKGNITGEDINNNLTIGKLLEQKRYADTVEAIEKQGFYNVLAELNEDETWQLTYAYRFVKNGNRAQEVLMHFRERFARSYQSKIAAFLIARISIELNHNTDKAVEWFQIYLDEDPDGPLAEEAIGRIMNIYKESGDRNRAANMAKIYIQKYPDGIFSSLARSIVEE